MSADHLAVPHPTERSDRVLWCVAASQETKPFATRLIAERVPAQRAYLAGLSPRLKGS